MSSIPYSAVYGWDLVEIPSNPSVSSSTNLGGNNIKFVIEQGEDIVYNGKNCYLTAQLQIVQVREDGTMTTLEPIISSGTRATPTGISIPHLTQNPLGSILDTMKLVIGSTDVNNYQYAASASTLYRMLFESKLEQDTVNSTSKIKVMNQDDQDDTLGVPYDNYIKLATSMGVTAGANTTVFGGLFSKRMLWALKNHMYNFDRKNINRLNIQIPIPMFYCDELLHFGVGRKVDLICSINQSWYQNIIQVVGSLYSSNLAGGGLYTITNKNSNFTAGTINISMLDMKLYMNRGYINKSYVPRGINGVPRKITYHMKQFSPVIANLTIGSTTTVTGTFDTGGRVSHIIVAFNSYPSNYPKYSPTDFSCGYQTQVTANGISEVINTMSAVNLIKTIQIKHGTCIYPQESYSLQTDGVAGSTNTNDLFRCYQDYCIMTDALRTPCGALMSYSEWMCNPLFVIKNKSHLNDISNIFSIRVDLSGLLAIPTNIIVLALYDSYLTFDYNEYAEVTSMTPSSAPPLIE